MNDLPPLPKGYVLAAVGSALLLDLGQGPALVTYPGWSRWRIWGRLYPGEQVGTRVFAVPKPRYTCPLEFSRYV